MPRTLDRRCGTCGAALGLEDVGKDRLGRPVCKRCAAAAASQAGGEDAPGIALDAAATDPEPMEPCPSCKRPLAATRRVCLACGFDRQSLAVAQASYGAAERHAAAAAPACRSCGYDLTGLTSAACPECGTPVSGRRSKASLKRVCTGCGYDLSGLKTRTCPECGTVDTPRRQKDRLDQREMRLVILRSVLLCLGGTLAMLTVQALAAGPVIAGLGLAMVAAACTVGFALYWACAAAFIGFDEPLRLTYARFCSVQGLYFGLSALAGLITYAWCFGWPLRAILYVVLILWLMEIDVEDAWSVALAGLVFNLALYLGLLAIV